MYVKSQLCLAILAIASSIPPTMARFYIGRFKTEPLKPAKGHEFTEESLQDILQEEGRSIPYIVYDAAEAEASSPDVHDHKQRRLERPPNMQPQQYSSYKRKGYPNSITKKFLGPPTKYGASGNYANEPNSGFVTKNPKDVSYWVPPFTAGGNVNVAFQFWVPISISGFFVQGRDLEKALKSSNPNAHIAKLFLEYLATNTTAEDIFGDFGSKIPFLEQGVSGFMDYVVPSLKSMVGYSMDMENEIEPFQVNVPGFGKTLSRHKRSADEDGWTTIGGKGSKTTHSNKQEDYSTLSQDTSSPSVTLLSSASDQLLSSLLRQSDEDGWTTIGVAAPVAEGRVLRVAEERALHMAPTDNDGWVTIGGRGNEEDDMDDDDSMESTAHLHSSSSNSNSIDDLPQRNEKDRLLWDHHVPISHNNIYESDDGPDLSSPIDSLNIRRPDFYNTRPPLSHSSSYRPSSDSSSYRPSSDSSSYRPSSDSSSYRPSSDSSSYRPSSYRPPNPSQPTRPSSSNPSSSSHFPYLTSFEDIPSSASASSRILDVKMRLSRLDYLFSNLHLTHEECRRRVLCEVTRDPETYSPLSDMVQGETRVSGDLRDLSRDLLNSAEGARLLSYIEAARLGEDRRNQCDVYRYRCRTEAREVINTDILPIWREVVRWLTVKVMAKDSTFL